MDNNKNFTHLHVHSSYSLLDGFSSQLQLAMRAKELGMNSLALTDHNHLLGIPQFQAACKEVGIKPILGYEAYYTPDTSILSMSASDRLQYAIDLARKIGPEKGFDYDAAYLDLEQPIGKKGKRLVKRKVPMKAMHDLLKDYEYNTKSYHLILIAKNQVGWQNLVKIQSESSKLCTYKSRYHCDLNILRKYSEGVICCTACIGSYFAQMIMQGKYTEAEKSICDFHNIFGENFYIEIQPLNIPKQHIVNFFLIKYAKQYNIKIIATNDVHYALKEDNEDHTVLVNMGLGRTINNGKSTKDSAEDEESDSEENTTQVNNMIYSHDYWLRSYNEMLDFFQIQAKAMFSNEQYCIDTDIAEHYMDYIIEALDNTNRIADEIEDIKLGSPIPLFPIVKVPVGYTKESYFEALCINGLLEYKKNNPNIDLNQYLKRLYKEIRVIKKKGFVPYFLTVYNYVNYCKQNKIPVGPGRGSAAGSLCLYVLSITSGIDPIEHTLSFERFLTEDRTSPPDIDLDFAYTKRPQVIKFFQDYYGIDFVSSIGTITTLGVKSGLKDVGRYFEMPISDVNKLTKRIDELFDKPDLSFKDIDALKDSEDTNEQHTYQEYIKLEQAYPNLFKYARKFEGNARNLGVHASGILITPVPINTYVPTRYVDGISVTLYEGPTLENFNFVKFDILGLKTLDVIENTLKFINPSYNYYNVYKVVPDFNDQDTYNLIRNKQTDGLFQLESDLFKHTIDNMQPTNINDIGALNAICRPGPLHAHLDEQYNDTKNGKIAMVEPLPNTLDLVKDTYGAIIYQEEVMAISVKVCGFNANQSDSIVRKIIGKKKKDKLAMLRRMMIYGKINEEGPEGWHDDETLPWYDPNKQYGDEIPGALKLGYTYKQMDDFFNLLMGFAEYCFNKSHAMCYAYVGYITAYLKTHYPLQFMAALLSMQSDQEKIEKYIDVSKNMGISVKVPDINISNIDFTIKDNDIYFGLCAIKGIGASAQPEIIKHKPYESFADFYNKTDHKVIKKDVLNNLICAGCFDNFNINRHSVLSELVKLKNLPEDDDINITANSSYTKNKCISYEKELLGMSITNTLEWDKYAINDSVKLYGSITNLTEKPDKKSNMMAFIDFTTSDNSNIRCLVFASYYSKCRNILSMFNTQDIFILEGKKSDKNTLIVNKVTKYDEQEKINANRQNSPFTKLLCQ